jgi:hypothetical protein
MNARYHGFDFLLGPGKFHDRTSAVLELHFSDERCQRKPDE